jgi:hypothetical protein
MKKRILVLLSVVALMVAMLATSVAPAFAAWDPMTGCKGLDSLVPAFSSPGVDGHRTDDGYICAHLGSKKTLSYYDNHPVTPL